MSTQNFKATHQNPSQPMARFKTKYQTPKNSQQSKSILKDFKVQTVRGSYLRGEWCFHCSRCTFLCSAHTSSQYAHNDVCPTTKYITESETEDLFFSLYKWLLALATLLYTSNMYLYLTLFMYSQVHTQVFGQ